LTLITPQIFFWLFSYTINYQIEHQTIDPHDALIVTTFVMAFFAIYIPLALFATAASMLHYEGSWLWKVLACLAVVNSGIGYFKLAVMFLLEYVKG
jgi:uncharacterized membrane protein